MSTENNSVTLPLVKKQSEKSPLVLGALALGAGLCIPSVAHAALIISNIDVTVTDSNYFLDLDGDANQESYIYAGSSFGGIYAKGGAVVFSGDYKYVHMFGAGSTVDASWFDGPNGFDQSSGELYSSFDFGNWKTLGAHGFVGFKFDDGTGNGDRFGWLELTRGSITIGQMGVQDSYNTAAAIPNATVNDVPEPGSLLLLASGALGLLGLRRRNQLAVEKQTH